MKISAIICTSNRPVGLANLLRALLAGQRRPDQIVIIEDRQGPEPGEILNECRGKGIQVCYLRRSPPGLTASRNLALTHATGELLSFFDDDTTPAPDYLQAIERIFEADTTVRLGGLAPVLEPWDHRPGPGDRLWQFLMHLAGLWSLPCRPRRHIFSQALCFQFGLRPCAFLPGVVTYRRAALENLNFDQRLSGYALAEDLDLSFSLSGRWQLYRSTALRIRHHHDPLHRPDRLTMGKMLVRNLLYVTCKHVGLRIGTLVVLLWQLLGLCFAHLLFTILGDTRAHVAWLRGIGQGLPSALYNLGTNVPKLLPVAPKPSPARAKHVLFIINTLEPGGAEQLTLTLLQGLNPGRFSASLLCLQDPGPLASQLPPSVKLYHNFSANKFDLSVLPSIVRLILRERVDLLVCVGNGGDRMFFSSLASLLTAKPLLQWCHSYPTLTEPTFEKLNRLLRTVTKTFVAVSAPQAQALSKVLHIPTSRIKLIDNALPSAAAIAKKPSAGQLASFRSKLDLPPDAFLIATVANLRPVKGHDLLIDAAAKVIAEHDNVYFLLIGQGPQKEVIRRRIQSLKIDPDRIIFLGQRFDVPQLLCCCDLYVCPSYRESFGLAILEAMASGLAVIATDTPAVGSLIKHNRTGLLVQPDHLARAILALISNPDRRGALAKRARKFARNKQFSSTSMVGAFEELFELLF